MVPGASTHLHGADLLPPAVQHFEDGPEGAFGHKAQDLRGGTGLITPWRWIWGVQAGGPAWGRVRGTEHPKWTQGTHRDLEDPAGFMGTQYGTRGTGTRGTGTQGTGTRGPQRGSGGF